MLYAKKDLYAVVNDRRFQVAFEGQLVPAEFEHLVDTGDVTDVAAPAESNADQSIAGPIADGEPTVDATDAAVELAQEAGVDLATVEGTGKDGRVLEGDVKKLIDAAE